MLNFFGITTNDEKIKRLVDLGFSKEKAKEALKKCGDDAEMAANFLLA